MSYKEQIDKTKIPQHVAIIMDGNGRWASQRGNNRIFGHEHGVEAVRASIRAAADIGVKYLTMYAFSTENWNRPKFEVDALMSLLVSVIKGEADELDKNNVRIKAIGDIGSLPESVRKELDSIICRLDKNSGLTVVMALSYSSQWEIIEAVKKIVCLVEKGEITSSDINNELFSNHLTTASIPDPELMIRTSGENRLSNFLLWQLAYSELYFTSTLWPDFKEENFFEAICDFQKRERRFGKTSEQINKP